MKNKRIVKKAGLRAVLSDTTPEQIEEFIEKNKKSDIPEDMLSSVKLKVYEKTGLNSSKEKKFNIKLWLPVAACLCLAVAVSLCVKYLDFEDKPSVTLSNDSSEDKFADNHSSEENFTEESNTSLEGDFAIEGITWEEAGETGRYKFYDGAVEILANEKLSEMAWATVVLEKITPLGNHESNGRPLYLSVAEIKIIKIYTLGDISGDIKEGDTIQILVDAIIEEDNILISHSYNFNEENSEKIQIYCLPMIEIGKEYVLAFGELENKTNKKIVEENYPYLKTSLMTFTSYPMFSVDFSEKSGWDKYRIMYTWPRLYVTAYEWYMKDNVSEDSNETKFYEWFKYGSESIFGITPSNPRKNEFS